MDIIQKYKDVRSSSMEMVKPLMIEDYVLQAEVFASPPKWNLAHTTWFFEELILTKFKKDYEVFHPKYSFLFNSYYNTVGERVARPNRGNLSRPTVDDIIEYREYVDNHILDFLKSNNIDKEINELIILGLNHEEQHQELFFSDTKYNFSVNPLYPVYSDKAFCEDENDSGDGFVTIDKGLYEVGFNGEDFQYDNELGRHKVYLEDFEISEGLVTNGEFIEFIEDGGYDRYQFWHDEALSWKKENNIAHPMYWHQIDGEWFQYTFAGMRKVQLNHILTHINYYEASAFAQWKGMRLPTEFEWEIASDKFIWGKRWEWTESAYLPYPGYKKADGAVGEYNGKFMVNQKVLRGASVVTPKNHSRKTYRNFFHPHVGYQFNGIRLVKL